MIYGVVASMEEGGAGAQFGRHYPPPVSVVSWHPALGKHAALGGYVIQVHDMEET